MLSKTFLGSLLLTFMVTALANNLPYQTKIITDKLQYPWSLAFLPDGQMLVTERIGKLKRINLDGKTKTDITGIPKVLFEGQGGLLGITLDPNFKANQLIYLAFAEPDGKLSGTSVARAKLTDTALTDIKIIFQQKPKYDSDKHFGSRLIFDNKGYLFITTGERFSEMKQAQTLDNHLGKMIRIHPDGRIPEDNPFVNQKNALPEIWSYGHRNIQGLTKHPITGEIWLHEHGPRGGDEINIPKPGKNYGWPKASYGIHYWLIPIRDDHQGQGFEEPLYHWTPSIAPSGMTFYRGNKFKDWKNDLFVGALKDRHLAKLTIKDNKVIKEEKLLTELESRIRDVVEGPDGLLYVLTDSASGKIIQLSPTSTITSL